MSNYTYSGYNDLGLNQTYLAQKNQFYPSQYRADHAVTVINGLGSGQYAYGQQVNIEATPPTGSRFVSWVVDSGGVSLANPYEPVTSFIQGQEDVVVRAIVDLHEGIPPLVTLSKHQVEVVDGIGSGTFLEGTRVGILATPLTGKQFTKWTVIGGDVALANEKQAHTYFTLGKQDVLVQAEYEDAAEAPSTPETAPGASIRVGDQVRVNGGVQTWATGEGMPSWVHGRTYPVIEIRTRNGARQLLLGNGINSWIREGDVARISESGDATIGLNSRVRVNQGVQTWATGEGMPSWVHGRTYPVIEIRTRNSVVELLLGEGINSWIRRSDVTLV